MAKYLHRIGAKHIKFDLEVVIHNLKLTGSSPLLLKIKVNRGKDKVEETQVMQYSSNSKIVQFDYPLSFQITMYKKSGKYSKKDLLINVLEIQGKSEIVLGELTVEFHKIAEIGKSIKFEEYRLENCKDPGARLCVSIDLTEHGKARAQFSTGNLKSASNLKSQFETERTPTDPKSLARRAMSFDTAEALISSIEDSSDSISTNSKGDTDYKDQESNRTRKGSVKTLRSAFCISEDLINEISITETSNKEEDFIPKEEIITIKPPDHEDFDFETDYKIESLDKPDIEPNEDDYKIEKIEVKQKESFKSGKKNSEKGFGEGKNDKSSDFSKNEKENYSTVKENFEFLKCDEPERQFDNEFDKDFEDSSSSEEAPEEVEILKTDMDVPITDMKESEPNAASQELRLNLKEKEAGLPDSRKTTCCGSCSIY